MTYGVQKRGGKILLWRLGPLNFAKQDMWKARAPKSIGMWAFPWPYYDMFFTVHQYERVMPKTIRSINGWPIHSKWYENEDGSQFNGKVEFTEEGRPIEGLFAKDEFWGEQRKWIKNVGPKTLPVKKFWYEGELYSHISRNGVVGNPGTFISEETDWFRIHSSELIKVVKKTRGNKPVPDRNSPYHYPGMKSSIDHLEVFIPRGWGKIT